MKIEMNSTNALVAYLDILGYSELIKSGEYANIAYGAIDSSIFRWKRNLEKHQFNLGSTIQENTSLQVISDTLIVALDQEAVFHQECGDVSAASPALKGQSLLIFLNLISYLIQDCMRAVELPISGAVVKGKYYSKGFDNLEGNAFIFSEALVDAHRLTKNSGNLPRVLIDQSALEGVSLTLLTEKDRPDREILQDETGLRYLNIYSSVFTDAALAPIIRGVASVANQQIKKHQNDPKILGKYIWFANHHNNLVKEIIESKATIPGLPDLINYQAEAFIQIPEFNKALV